MYKQLINPRLNTRSGAGWCLWFAQEFFGAPHLFPSAWEAYQDTTRKQTGTLPTGAAVLLWFEHWGTYRGKYANWGHVAIHVPGRGIYTSPWYSSYGQEIYQSIEEIERVFNARYVGWTDNISGVRVAEPQRKEKPEKEIDMRVIYNTQNKDDKARRAVVGELTFHVQGPGASRYERKMWGKPVNVNQVEWNSALAQVNARRGMLGLPKLKGFRGESMGVSE